MITRRDLYRLCLAASVTQLFPESVLSASTSGVTINGDFGFKLQNGSLAMNVKNVTIDGLSIPTFSWKWVGLAIGQGILMGFGGMVFGALANAILGNQGKSIEQLLKEQLAAIAQIVQDALLNNNLQQYEADVDAYGRLYREYLDTRRKSTLDFLLNNGAVTLSRLSATGFPGYRTYLIGAGLRLAALQDEMKTYHTGPRSFVDQRDAAIEFHKEVNAKIEEQTSPATVFQRFNGGSWGWLQGTRFRVGQINDKILSEKINGIVLINGDTLQEASEGEARLALLTSGNAGLRLDQWVSLAATKDTLLRENTEIGSKIIDRWNHVRLLRA